jgi:hypothetical protein
MIDLAQQSEATATQRREVEQLKSGAATANGAPHALTAGYVYYRDIFETDPDTSAAWASGGVNALQIGPEMVT